MALQKKNSCSIIDPGATSGSQWIHAPFSTIQNWYLEQKLWRPLQQKN